MEPERPDTVIEDRKQERTWIYVAAGAILGGLFVWAIVAYDNNKESDEANAKADEFAERLEDEGLTAPDQDVIVSLLGTDGGRVCTLAGDDLAEAELKQRLYTNGASGPGMRAGPADGSIMQAAVILTEVYCPDKTQDMEDLQDDLEFDDVIRG